MATRYRRKPYRFVSGRGKNKQVTIKRFRLSPFDLAYDSVEWTRVPGSKGRYWQGKYRGHNVYITRYSHRKLGNAAENVVAEVIARARKETRQQAKQSSTWQIFQEGLRESREETWNTMYKALEDAEDKKRLRKAIVLDALNRYPHRPFRDLDGNLISYDEWFQLMLDSPLGGAQQMVDDMGIGGREVMGLDGRMTTFQEMLDDDVNPAYYRKKE